MYVHSPIRHTPLALSLLSSLSGRCLVTVSSRLLFTGPCFFCFEVLAVFLNTRVSVSVLCFCHLRLLHTSVSEQPLLLLLLLGDGGAVWEKGVFTGTTSLTAHVRESVWDSSVA